MKKKSNLILERDYERYTVHLPWFVILRGKANKYIYSELEKNHPCFSNEWCFGSKNHLKKTGIESDVVVINKFKLAEYKQRFPGKKLWLENLERRSFSTKNYFREITICIAAVIIIVSGVSLELREKYKNEKFSIEEVSEEIPEKKRNDSVLLFLDLIEKNGGRISSLRWNSDGYNEVFSADIKFLYPEQLLNQKFSQNIQISNVQYKEDKPLLSITLNDHISDSWMENSVEQKANSILPEKNKINRGDIREIFRDYKINLQEEKFLQLNYQFVCPVYFELNGSNFIEAINKVAENADCGISKLYLNKIENVKDQDGFSGEITFDERLSFREGINLKPLAWRTNLIVEKKEFSRKEKTIVRKNTVERVEGEILGEIMRSDGTKIKFYKNPQGKVITKESK